ncbi:uncharacterized protein N0V96_011535 [Colletotrichum fioriniae]|uniref:uncharacterized protein n=1 Tax=Colletotrichum fioriniae TaxID=710243 RepID=UPI0032DA51A3|nr:hypothetical protein N0V96_011535 [Colletotrichum fioriniae]
MSSEYGGISDPINFLDAEVVKYDGTVVMASQEPDLLWSLRGGGGGFGTQMIDEVVKFNHSTPHPKVNYFMYLMPQQLLHTVLEKPEPDLGDTVIFHVYDALGEKHGRATFRWILEKPGAIDRTRVTNMKGVLDMQRNANVIRGTMKTLYAPMAVADLDRATISRAIEVYDNIEKLDQTIHDMSSVIFEFLLLRGSSWAEPAIPLWV